MITFEGPQCMWTNPSQNPGRGQTPPIQAMPGFWELMEWHPLPIREAGKQYLMQSYTLCIKFIWPLCMIFDLKKKSRFTTSSLSFEPYGWETQNLHSGPPLTGITFRLAWLCQPFLFLVYILHMVEFSPIFSTSSRLMSNLEERRGTKVESQRKLFTSWNPQIFCKQRIIGQFLVW